MKRMTKEIKSEVIPIRLSPELKADLQKLADADKRNLSDFIRVQLMNLVEASKKKTSKS